VADIEVPELITLFQLSSAELHVDNSGWMAGVEIAHHASMSKPNAGRVTHGHATSVLEFSDMPI